jgi:hypothetical protein
MVRDVHEIPKSGELRIKWPGNSVYMYLPPSDEQVERNKQKRSKREWVNRHRQFMRARAQWAPKGWGRAGCRKHVGGDIRVSGVVFVWS